MRDLLGIARSIKPAVRVKLADGGSKNQKFQIQPQGGSVSGPVRPFSTIDPNKINIMSLATAFDDAIAHHKSLDRADRIANSQAAKAIMKKMKISSLLGKNEKLLKSEKGYKGEEPLLSLIHI